MKIGLVAASRDQMLMSDRDDRDANHPGPHFRGVQPFPS
jgi:hypothetical protein